MDVRQLRYFLEIAEQGSITAASRTLNIAQPALSHHLRNMEARLGTPLLTRSASGVTPTEAGDLLRTRARMILNDLARTEDDIRNLDKSPSGAVRLGLPGTISDIITLPLMETLLDHYPRITLNVAEAMSGFVTGWLDEGRVDLAVLYTASVDQKPQGEKLVEEELVWIRKAGPADPAPVRLGDLGKAALILPSVGHGLRDLIESYALTANAAVHVAFEIDSYRNIKRLVSKGLGTSILPLHAVSEEIAQGTLTCHSFAPSLRRGAVLRQSGTLTRAQLTVQETIHAIVVDLVKTGKWAGASLPGQ